MATVAVPPPNKNIEGFEPERERGSRQWLDDVLDRRALRCGVRPVVSTTPSTLLRKKKKRATIKVDFRKRCGFADYGWELKR